MRRLRLALASLVLMFGSLLTTGCNNLSPRDNVSPRLQQQIDNQNGKIDRIESNQNAIKFAIERRNENSGWQILQGDGGLLLAFGIVSILVVTFYFYRTSNRNEQIVHLLVEQIKSHQDAELEERIMQAAMYSPVEKEVYYHLSRKK